MSSGRVDLFPVNLAWRNGIFPIRNKVAEILLEAGAKVDFREETGELYPRTTLADEPLRLALRNKHFVSDAVTVSE